MLCTGKCTPQNMRRADWCDLRKRAWASPGGGPPGSAACSPLGCLPGRSRWAKRRPGGKGGGPHFTQQMHTHPQTKTPHQIALNAHAFQCTKARWDNWFTAQALTKRTKCALCRIFGRKQPCKQHYHRERSWKKRKLKIKVNCKLKIV